MLGEVLQVLAAIGLVIILLIVGFYVYNSEQVNAMRQAGKLQKQTTVFSGIYDLNNSNPRNTGFSTIDKSDPSYIDLGYSVNQSSGAEFTYSFWLYLDYTVSGTTPGSAATFPIDLSNTQNDPRTSALYTDQGLTYVDNSKPYTPSKDSAAFNSNSANRKGKGGPSDDLNYMPVVLFVRGENKGRVYKGLCYGSSGGANPSGTQGNQSKADVLIKCPLVKLEKGGDVLSVEFNTTYHPDPIIKDSKYTCNTPDSTVWNSMNSYKIGVQGLRSRSDLQKSFFLVTVTLQDTYPTDPISIRNKIRARIYINATLELDKYISYASFSHLKDSSPNSLRLNNGNLYVNPTVVDANNTSLTYSKPVANKNEIVMADLNYYNYALTPDQVGAIYNGGFTNKFITNLTNSNTVVATTASQAMINSKSSFAAPLASIAGH